MTAVDHPGGGGAVATERQRAVATCLQQLPLGTARQQRGKWSANDRIEHHLHGTLLPYFQEGMVQPRISFQRFVAELQGNAFRFVQSKR
jgi:hypothetical protein